MEYRTPRARGKAWLSLKRNEDIRKESSTRGDFFQRRTSVIIIQSATDNPHQIFFLSGFLDLTLIESVRQFESNGKESEMKKEIECRYLIFPFISILPSCRLFLSSLSSFPSFFFSFFYYLVEVIIYIIITASQHLPPPQKTIATPFGNFLHFLSRSFFLSLFSFF